ncbi:TPA: hypothetical protein ACGU4V_002736, partial [Vibrio vulnificus]
MAKLDEYKQKYPACQLRSSISSKQQSFQLWHKRDALPLKKFTTLKTTKPSLKTGFLNKWLTAGVAVNGQTFCGTRWSQTKIIQQKQKDLSISAEV